MVVDPLEDLEEEEEEVEPAPFPMSLLAPMVLVSLEMVRVCWSAHLGRRRFASMSLRRSVQPRPARSATTIRMSTVRLSRRRFASRPTRRLVSTLSLQHQALSVLAEGTGSSADLLRARGAASQWPSKCAQISTRSSATQRPSQSAKQWCLFGPLRNALSLTNPTVRSPRSKCASWDSHRVTAQSHRLR